MLRTLALVAMLCCLCTLAPADQLVLSDGQTLAGTVTIRGDKVFVQTPDGTQSFPRGQVARIEFKEGPESEFTKRLAALGPKDVEGRFALAQWADASGLSTDARELYARILQLNPDHAGARRAMGYVKLDGRWVEFDKGLDLCRSLLEAGKFKPLLAEHLPAMADAADADKLAAVMELQGLAQLRSKDFKAAGQTFADLASKSTGPAAARYAAVAGILSDNPDGVYVLTTAYPPAAQLTGEKKSLPAGPASLAEPLALDAALHDRAKAQVDAARELMKAGEELLEKDAPAADAKFAEAGKALAAADALVPDLGRSYRVQIAQRRIGSIRADVENDAAAFDKSLKNLGRGELTTAAYHDVVAELRKNLDNIRRSLQTVLELARPFPQELSGEAAWAQQDLRTIESKRDILAAELNAKE